MYSFWKSKKNKGNQAHILCVFCLHFDVSSYVVKFIFIALFQCHVCYHYGIMYVRILQMLHWPQWCSSTCPLATLYDQKHVHTPF